MSTTPGRNDPCPCGSGRKYKNCHAGRASFGERAVAGIRLPWVIGIAVAAVAILIGVSMLYNRGPGISRGPAQPLSSAPASGAMPGAWEYDSLTNKHFDPGHGHWHDGPPPANASQQTPTLPSSPSTSITGGAVPAPPSVPAGTTPQPWQYDAATNRHYDPTHGHWHQGPPPAGAR